MYMLVQASTWGQGDALELEQDEKQVTVGTAAVSVLSPNPQRIAILFQNLTGTDITLSTTPKIVAGAGILVHNGADPIVISDDRLPGLASRQWYAVSSAAAQTLEVIDVRWT